MSDALKVSLAEHPYPYRSSLAICSDIDECNLDTFIRLHRHMSCAKHGLGLPIADSFFAAAKGDEQLALLDYNAAPQQRNQEIIAESIRAGIIDSIHSWGDFNTEPLLAENLNQIAQATVNWFQDHSLSVPIWINHGSPKNAQNLKSRLAPSYQGDNPDSALYTMPLVKKLGVEFYWWSEVVNHSLFLDSRVRSWDDVKLWLPNECKNWIKRLQNKANRVRPFSQIQELLQSETMRDGSSLFAFTRFNQDPKGVWALPTRDNLHLNLNQEALQALVEDQGTRVLYTHLGISAQPSSQLFSEETQKAFETLAQFYHDKLIWVATTSRLLKYHRVVKHLQWSYEWKGSVLSLQVKNTLSPDGASLPLTPQDLAGIHFRCSSPVQRVQVLLGNVPIDVTVLEQDARGVSIFGWEPESFVAPDFLETL